MLSVKLTFKVKSVTFNLIGKIFSIGFETVQ